MRGMRPSPAMAVALLALIVALSGTAVAATLVTTSQIKDGTIQVKDLSKKARVALKGTRGRAGATGANGTPGTPGAPGARGPSDGFVFTHAGIVDLATTPVFTANLPAGRYLVTTSFMINNNDSVSRRPLCTLAAGTDTHQVLVGTSENTRNDDTAVGTLTVGHEFTTAGAATLTCDSGGGAANTMRISDVQITAVQVATLTKTAAQAAGR